MKKQQGIATLLIILLIGVAMGVTAVGTVLSIRNTQEQQVTSNTVLNAQALAWSAAEVLKQHIESRSSPGTDLAGLVSAGKFGIELGIPEMQGADPWAKVEATLEIDSFTSDYIATIYAWTNLGTAAQASSIVELVFRDPGTGGVASSCNDPGDFSSTFNYKLDASGGITLNGCTKDGVTEGLDINVDGDATITNTAPKFRNLQATGNITIGTSSTEAESVFANGWVKLTNGGFVKEVQSAYQSGGAQAAISILEGANAHYIYANGVINLASGDTVEVKSRSGVIATGETDFVPAGQRTDDPATYDNKHNKIIAAREDYIPEGSVGGTVIADRAYIKVQGAGVHIGMAEASGPITWNDTAGTILAESIRTPADFTCPTYGDDATVDWDPYVDPTVHPVVAVGGTTGIIGEISCATYGIFGGTVTLTESEVLQEITEYVPRKQYWDAYDYVAEQANLSPASHIANFYFYREGYTFTDTSDDGTTTETTKDVTRVRIRNIKGIEDDDYYLHETTNAVCDDAECTSEVMPGNALCWTSNDPCINYGVFEQWDTTDGDVTTTNSSYGFLIRGISLLPAVYVFEGNLDVKQAHGVNTLIATLNVEAAEGANHTNKAVNWAGPDAVCLSRLGGLKDANDENVPGGTGSGLSTYVHEPFLPYFPTNFCESNTETEFASVSVGNVAIGAGSVKDAKDPEDPDDDIYQGGIMKLKNNVEFFGLVIAGNAVSTSGDATIYGNIIALALDKANNPTPNALNNKTVINYCDDNSLPKFWNPDTPNPDTPTGTCAGSLKLHWSRYL